MIADIGGYARFMKVHRVNLAHAQTIIASLLEAVIDGAEPLLKLAKLERDHPEISERSFFRRFVAWMKLTWRSIPYFVGARKSCEGFETFPA